MKSFALPLLVAAGSLLANAVPSYEQFEYDEYTTSASLERRAGSDQNGTDRVQFIPVPDTFQDQGDQNIYNNVAKARGGADNFNSIDLVLLNSPPLEQGWQAFFNQINNNTASSLDNSVRELVICRIAVLNRAQYEWDQHAPILTSLYNKSNKSGGDVLNFVKSTAPRALSSSSPPSNIPPSLDQAHLAAFDYADAMTLDVNVTNAIFGKLGANGFDNREIIELTTTIAAYNAVSRFLVALHIGTNNLTWLPDNMQGNVSSEYGGSSSSSTSGKKGNAAGKIQAQLAGVVGPMLLAVIVALVV